MAKLTVGPCLFNWHINDWKDFYFKIADCPVDEVYLGEVVCLRRDHFFKDALEEVINRLQQSGKKVIISTIKLVLGQPEFSRAKELIETHPNNLIEVNDISVLSLVENRPFVVGPGINNYNENTLQVLEQLGAERFCLPYELHKDSITKLCQATKKDVEVLVFGRVPLAISARCYHARLHNKPKVDCEYVCNQDYNGKKVTTLHEEDFLAINGTQTLSNSYANLIMELDCLQKQGINHFRISPHSLDMVTIVNTFHQVLHKTISPKEGFRKLLKVLPEKNTFSNGFYYGIAGKQYISNNNIE